MKTLSTLLAVATLAIVAVGCASHESASTGTYNNTSTSVTSK